MDSFIIDRKNAKVSKWDKILCEIVKKIIDDNNIVKNRTGIDT